MQEFILAFACGDDVQGWGRVVTPGIHVRAKKPRYKKDRKGLVAVGAAHSTTQMLALQVKLDALEMENKILKAKVCKLEESVPVSIPVPRPMLSAPPSHGDQTSVSSGSDCASGADFFGSFLNSLEGTSLLTPLPFLSRSNSLDLNVGASLEGKLKEELEFEELVGLADDPADIGALLRSVISDLKAQTPRPAKKKVHFRPAPTPSELKELEASRPTKVPRVK